MGNDQALTACFLSLSGNVTTHDEPTEAFIDGHAILDAFLVTPLDIIDDDDDDDDIMGTDVGARMVNGGGAGARFEPTYCRQLEGNSRAS